MELKKGYKQTDLGVIPDDWEIKEFADVMDGFSSGQTPYRAIVEYYKGDIPWITSGELNYNIITDTIEKITIEGAREANLKKIPKGTFLFAITGLEAAGTRGSCAITGIEATTNQSCMALYPKKGLLTTPYLYHYYVRYGNELAFKYCQGTKQQSYTGGIAKKLPIIVPPSLLEQTAIANALSDMDALISQTEKLIEKKKAIKQGAMQELLKPKEGWVTKKVPEICWFQEGPGVRKHQFTQNGVKLLNGTNIQLGKLELDNTDKYISEIEAYGWYSHFLVDKEDVLIACSGVSIDKFHEKVTIAKKINLPLCMNTSTMRFKINSKYLNQDYFVQFLKSNFFKEQISGKATGSAQLNFGPSHIKMIDVPLPSIEEQSAIGKTLVDFEYQIATLENKLQKLKLQKQGMMQALLTGKIRLV
ncbi:MAG: restriction endonuclease subunit S [Cryomorphaceae bacterium]|nr:restriction endonuclease subunit S [Cryomorphaceae bacterium]